MKKVLRKSVTFFTASLLTAGILSIPAVKQIPVFQTSITVEASSINSGAYGGKFVQQCGDNAWLYFSITDSSKKTATLSGCVTTAANLSVTIPSTATFQGVEYKVTAIGDSAFKAQTNITYIYGGRNLESIGVRAFSGCGNLQDVSMAKDKSGRTHLDSIGEYAFSNCTNLNRTTLIDTKHIGAHAFEQCSQLDEIYLQETETIGDYAFYNCKDADYIDLSGTSVTTIPNYCFSFAYQAEYIRLPESLTSIGNSAFSDCSKVETVYIPEHTTKIGSSAFKYNVKLETVMVPESVTEIGESAFNCCDSMKYFVCKNPATTFGSYSVGYQFGNKRSDFVIWGKGGNTQSYASSKGFTYRDVSTAPALAKEAYKDYMWKVGNVAASWAVNGSSSGNYLILDEHRPYDSLDAANTKFGGSCYGMAAVSALTRNGDIQVRDFAGSSFSKISNITRSQLSDYTKSYVNTCWSAQNLYQEDFEVPGSSLFSNKEMITYMEYITYGADAAVFSYSKNGDASPNGGHAVVCFGLEYINDASDKTNSNRWSIGGKQMNARILIYDVNYSTFDEARCFYINTNTGEWTNGQDTMYSYYGSDNTLVSNMAGYYDSARGEYVKGGYIELVYNTDKMFSANGLSGRDFLYEL